ALGRLVCFFEAEDGIRGGQVTGVQTCALPISGVGDQSVDECRLYGASVTLVDGLITDAGRMAAEKGGPLGWYDVSTLKEPYRIRSEERRVGKECRERERPS